LDPDLAWTARPADAAAPMVSEAMIDELQPLSGSASCPAR
jgi:hypothetical protein